MTRGLGWITLSGVGTSVNYCREELEILKNKNYVLDFIQPSEADVRTIRQDINNVQSARNELERLADKLSKELNMSIEEILDKFGSELSNIKKKKK